jgi:hypothetical protein
MSIAFPCIQDTVSSLENGGLTKPNASDFRKKYLI